MAFDNKKKKFLRKKVCRFCRNKDLVIDYKNTSVLEKVVSESGKIEPMRITGTCAKHQRKVAREVKRARQMALMAYIGT